MSGALAHARALAELERRIRDMIDQSCAELLQISCAPADPGPLTIEKLKRICGIRPKPRHKFRFAEQALSIFLLPFPGINLWNVS